MTNAEIDALNAGPELDYAVAVALGGIPAVDFNFDERGVTWNNPPPMAKHAGWDDRCAPGVVWSPSTNGKDACCAACMHICQAGHSLSMGTPEEMCRDIIRTIDASRESMRQLARELGATIRITRGYDDGLSHGIEADTNA